MKILLATTIVTKLIYTAYVNQPRVVTSGMVFKWALINLCVLD